MRRAIALGAVLALLPAAPPPPPPVLMLLATLLASLVRGCS
ncbi:hypothetical protein [Duganella sp. CF517]|nr:hypothetical protein [Duganella sp. CF517]